MKLDIEILKSLLVNPRLDLKKNNFYAQCPWCGFDEFGISTKDGHKFGCFRGSKCGESGNIFKFLKKIERLDILKDRAISLDYSAKLIDQITAKIQDETLDLSIPTIKLPFGLKRIYSHPYLDGRGFDKYEKYKFYSSSFNPEFEKYVVLAVEQDGQLKGYVGRHIWDKKKIDKWNKKCPENKILRYNNSHSEFSKMILGYEDITENTKTVIIVEGAFDKFNVDKILDLDSQEEIKCVCTWGAKISNEQIFLLQIKNIQSIILMFDPDVINKIKAHALDLMNNFEEVRIGIHSTKDPGEFNLDDIELVLNSMQNVLSFFINKVQILTLK